MSHKELFAKMIGRWEGPCRTWLEPDTLSDESMVAGEFAGVLDDRFLRHTYSGQIFGEPRHGEELIALNAVTKKFQMTCIDDYHMNYAIMFSEGDAIERGFEVFGLYDVTGAPRWGWRTTYEFIDRDQLTITAYIVSPEGEEAKAVETVYRRVGS